MSASRNPAGNPADRIAEVGRDRGIPLLPPDINESQLNFSVEFGKGVRFGLTAIKGLGEGAVNSIIAARTRCVRKTRFTLNCSANTKRTRATPHFQCFRSLTKRYAIAFAGNAVKSLAESGAKR